MTNPSEHNVIREELIETANQLVRLCHKHGAFVSGFIWGMNPPLVLSFGNCQEQHDASALRNLYAELCSLTEEKRRNRGVETRHADRVQ